MFMVFLLLVGNLHSIILDDFESVKDCESALIQIGYDHAHVEDLQCVLKQVNVLEQA